MKKVLFSLAMGAMVAVVACGPSATELKEKATADSIANAAKEQARLDSISLVEKAKADSINAIAEKAKADSIAAAEEAKAKKGKKK